MHEIITLQLGQRSNYLATHFWNAQESYFTYSDNEQSPVDHDVHFRPGVGADGSETYTPRTVIYDLKGGFGSLRKYNALYEATNDSTSIEGLWDGSTVVHKQAPIVQSEYQKSLDQGVPAPELNSKTVRYWSDFNRVFFHPRSIVQLSEYELNSQLMPFQDWNVGAELFRDLDKEHDLLDRDVRLFAEECDQLSAFQLFTGSDDAWGGFAARYIDRIRDEFGKTSVWVWAIEDGQKAARDKQLLRLMNTAYSIDEISTQASGYIPVSEPPKSLPAYVQGVEQSPWRSSALLASAIETVTMPSRSRNGLQRQGRFGDLESILNVNGSQKIMKLQASVIFNGGSKIKEKVDVRKPDTNNMASTRGLGEDENDQSEENLDIDFTPRVGESTSRPKKSHIFGQVLVHRGSVDPEDEVVCAEPDMAERRRRIYLSKPIVERFSSYLPFPALDSFPHDLFICPSPSSSLGIDASLSTSTDLADKIKDIQRVVGRIAPIDQREAIYNSLGEIAENYVEGYDSGSGSDNDDD